MFQSTNVFAVDNIFLFVYIYLWFFTIASFEDVNFK